MKYNGFIVFFFYFSITFVSSQSVDPINAIIGDTSFLEKFGEFPNIDTDEGLRISTHLAYVEEYLRNQSVSFLSSEMKEKRFMLLNLLHDYWTMGVFPYRFDLQDKRTPCLIDNVGNICAVGYLVEKSIGRGVAEKINYVYQYQLISGINDSILENWISKSGLTMLECAMIQPTYNGWNRADTGDNKSDTTPVFYVVETMPQFIGGGDTALYSYIQKNLNYPSLAKEMNIEGKIFVEFIITPQGEVEKTTILKGLGYGLDEEAIRVIQSTSQKWHPGIQREKKVKVCMRLPIQFSLD